MKMPLKADHFYSIVNKEGKSFSDFLSSVGEEKKSILQFTFRPQPSDPTMKSADNDKTVGYIARVNYLQSKAQAFATKARGVVIWTLKSDPELNMSATMAVEVAKAYLADFEEEADDWRTLSDSLHERLWTGRKDVEQANKIAS
jgi:hypothetical protein